jgi:hypothetical protein
MSQDATVRTIPFGTVAAIFSTVAAAEAAAAELVEQGYPRELVAVLTGRAWEQSDGRATGFRPDPELRVALVPTAPLALAPDGRPVEPSPALAAFTGAALAGRSRPRNPAFWPMIVLVIGVVATLLTLYGRDWMTVVTVGLVALHAVLAAAVLAYTRNHEITFPFRENIPVVEERLEQGGALVTVACSLPYRRPVQAVLTRHSGEVVGYAPETVYPVPA